jgi:hypothetical protein
MQPEENEVYGAYTRPYQPVSSASVGVLDAPPVTDTPSEQDIVQPPISLLEPPGYPPGPPASPPMRPTPTPWAAGSDPAPHARPGPHLRGGSVFRLGVCAHRHHHEGRSNLDGYHIQWNLAPSPARGSHCQDRAGRRRTRGDDRTGGADWLRGHY